MNVVNLDTLQGNAAFALDQGVWALVVIPGALFIQAQITGVLLVVLTEALYQPGIVSTCAVEVEVREVVDLDRQQNSKAHVFLNSFLSS